MNVYTNNQFVGFWPVGSAAVVVADSSEKAATILNEKLGAMGLKPGAEPKSMVLVNTSAESVEILCDGEY